MTDAPTTPSDRATTPPAIRCERVVKRYVMGGRTVEALRGLDLEIVGPGFFGIMGPSGSGKSTLLHLLAALDVPDEGEVAIAGDRLSTLSERELTTYRRRRIGVVFQQFNLIPTLDALDNVMLPGMLAGEPPGPMRERARELLNELGILDRAHHRPEALSGGEQQRVAIARALFFRPPVILADEPTGALDSVTSERLWSLLARIARDHSTTVVMVTHEPEAAAHCERVVHIRDGRVERETTNDPRQHHAGVVGADAPSREPGA